MTIKRNISCILFFGFLLTGCQIASTGQTSSTSDVSLPTIEVAIAPASPNQLPTEMIVPLPTATSEVFTEPVVMPDYSASYYVDDRSTPAALVVSFANAINRHEYLRAYSYWQNPKAYFGTIDDFTASYENTASVSVTLGNVSSEGAAGSVYYTIPAVLTQMLNNNSQKREANCYILRFPQPANYGAPPITPMHFDQYTTQSVAAGTSDKEALTSACSASDQTQGLNLQPPSFETLADLSAANYIDNRSGAVEVVSSLLNAINRKEYVRAYSYWQDTTAVGSYDSYAAGFSDTGSVTATFGTVTSDAGAGQFYYQVPVGMIVTTTTNTTQTFVGCYTLHLSNPGMQGVLPFQPLGITQGHFTKMANGTDVSSQLAGACK